MSTMTFDRLPTGHWRPPLRRPSVRAAWLWENRKASNLWYWPALALLCAVGLLSGYAQFMEYRTEFLAQGTTWAVIWGQGSLMSSMLFIPLAVGAFIAQSVAGEHEGRNWQRMSASGLMVTMVAGKLLHTLQTALATTLVFLTEFVLTGLLLGFNPAELGPYMARVVPVALSVWVVEVFVMWVGTIASSFAAIVSILLLTTIGGFALSLVAPPLAGLYPLSLITSAFASRQPDSIASMDSMLVAGSIAVAWVVVWTSALLRRTARTP